MIPQEKRRELRELATKQIMELVHKYMLDDEDDPVPENVKATLDRITNPADTQDPAYHARKAFERMQIHAMKHGTARSKETLLAKAKKADSLAKFLRGKGTEKDDAAADKQAARAKALRDQAATLDE